MFAGWVSGMASEMPTYIGRVEMDLLDDGMSPGSARAEARRPAMPSFHQFTSGIERERRASNDWFSNTYGPAAW